MTSLKVTQIGNSLGVVLPKDILAMLDIDKGDRLYVSKTRDGINLSMYDADFAHQMELAEETMREDRDVLRKLAE